MNVLIADSSAPIIERIKNMIIQENKAATVYGAVTSEFALQIVKENKPAIVLLGMNLPGNGSIDLLQAIKKTGLQTSIIILSIHMNNTVMEQCKLLGATVFLDKFLEFEKIPGLINTLAAIN